MNEEVYRDQLAHTLKKTDRGEAKEILNKEAETSEYKIADMLADSSSTYKREREAFETFSKLNQKLRYFIAPSSSMVDYLLSKEKDSSYKEQYGILNIQKANEERFDTVLRALIDDEFKKSLVDQYKVVAEAKKAFKDLQKRNIEAADAVRIEIERLGGDNSVRKMLGDRAEALREFIKTEKDTEKLKKELWPESYNNKDKGEQDK